MTFDYNLLEKELEEACEAVHKDFTKKFGGNDSYMSVGGAKLEAFITGMQAEFEATAVTFLKKHNFQDDPEAKKRALTITKLYAKRCVEDFSRV